MSHDFFIEYDQSRSFSNKAVRSLCYAPFTSLFFDNRGNVRVCCHNWTNPVGNIVTNGIDEIWHSAKINVLRETLSGYEFAQGCDFCAFQTSEGAYQNASMRRFDEFPVASQDPMWPMQMEFSISNVCNLECIMCNGLASSAIRSRREKLSPLPRLYSNEVLDSLRKYLPHLRRAKFLGGEPFLVEEHFRLWDMMTEDSSQLPCHVTTNGTQYSSRIEGVLGKLPMSFSVSLDGVSKKTVESIRVNAKFEQIIENLLRFRDYTRARGTYLSLTFCLMRQNWEEFGDFCLFADAWDCSVGVNTVLHPPEFGVYTLPLLELRQIVKKMELQAIELEARLRKNRTVWFGELDRLRAKCDPSRSQPGSKQK